MNKGQITIGIVLTTTSVLGGLFFGYHRIEIEPIKDEVKDTRTEISSLRKDFSTFQADTSSILGKLDERTEWLAKRQGYVEDRVEAKSEAIIGTKVVN